MSSRASWTADAEMESLTETAPPITGFFRGWWCFFTWEYTPPRGEGDRTDYQAFLKRMGLSEAGVWVYKIISLIADLTLSMALLIHYDDWFTEHNIRMDRHTGNLSGIL